MKKFKFIIILVFLLLIVANTVLSQTDYANLSIVPGDNSYILLNDSQKYCYMRYYGCEYKADLHIREGKNFFLSLFKQGFKAFSKDPERNYLFCEQGGFGVHLYGLYIREDSMDDLLKPIPENIYKIIVFNSDGNEVLSFNSENEEAFGWFIENYENELNNYFFPNKVKDEDVYNEEYEINIEYQNGEITRFLRCIDEDAFKIMRKTVDGQREN